VQNSFWQRVAQFPHLGLIFPSARCSYVKSQTPRTMAWHAHRASSGLCSNNLVLTLFSKSICLCTSSYFREGYVPLSKSICFLRCTLNSIDFFFLLMMSFSVESPYLFKPYYPHHPHSSQNLLIYVQKKGIIKQFISIVYFEFTRNWFQSISWLPFCP